MSSISQLTGPCRAPPAACPGSLPTWGLWEDPWGAERGPAWSLHGGLGRPGSASQSPLRSVSKLKLQVMSAPARGRQTLLGPGLGRQYKHRHLNLPHFSSQTVKRAELPQGVRVVRAVPPGWFYLSAASQLEPHSDPGSAPHPPHQ